jgi:rubrerythrin
MNEKFQSVDEVLEFAIKNEQEAADLYQNLAAKMNDSFMKKCLLSFSEEEMEHKKTLERVRKGKKLLDSKQKVIDLKIADYITSVKPHADMTYQELLIFAMKAEKAAYRLYSHLAETAEDRKLRDIFLGLANEEAKHKLRFEIQYDDEVHREN